MRDERGVVGLVVCASDGRLCISKCIQSAVIGSVFSYVVFYGVQEIWGVWNYVGWAREHDSL